MPAEVTHKSGFRLRALVIAFFVILGTGYVLGLVHGQAMTGTAPPPRKAVHVTPTNPEG